MYPPDRGRGPYRGRGGRTINPVIQHGNKKLIAADFSKSQEESSSSNAKLVQIMDFIQNDSALYKQIMDHIQEQQSDTFAAKVSDTDQDDIRSYEKGSTKEVIFLLENADIQWKDDPWVIFRRYLAERVTIPGESYKPRNYYENILKQTCEITHFQSNQTTTEVYNFSKIIIKKILSFEEWGISTLSEREVRNTPTSPPLKFTYWDYIQSFYKTFYYENPRKKHTWFIKICSHVYSSPIPNWFIQWWALYGPTAKILPDNFSKLYYQWLKSSPIIDKLQHSHICAPGKITLLYFFIEFSIPWIYKWVPEVGFNEFQIPCLYKTYHTKFWDKLTKMNHNTKRMEGQDLLDEIAQKIKEYTQDKGQLKANPDEESPFKHITKRIQLQQGAINKEEIISAYMKEVKADLMRNLKNLDNDNISEKSDVSMKSITSNEENSFAILAGESQSPEKDDDHDEFIKNLLQQIQESAQSAKGKEKE